MTLCLRMWCRCIARSITRPLQTTGKMLARIAVRSRLNISRSVARSASYQLRMRQATVVSSATLDWSKLTVADIGKWDTATVVRNLSRAVTLKPRDLRVLEMQEINGKALLGWDERKMERDGLSRGAIEALLPLCATLPNKGESPS